MRFFFNLIRNTLAIVGLLGLIAGSYVAFSVAKSYGLPPRLFMLKALKKIGLESSILAKVVTPSPLRSIDLVFPSPGSSDWQGHGARTDRILQPVNFAADDHPIPKSWAKRKKISKQPTGENRIISIDNAKNFLIAIRKAEPGDILILRPGNYKISERSIYVSSGGTSSQPIIVRAEKLGEVFLELNSLEGFYINSPYWVFENLDIKGTCGSDDYCEHAFHVVGNGKGFVLRNNRIHDFNSPIKANGIDSTQGRRIHPDGILLEANSFFNARARRTDHPVSFIDIVGVNHFIVSGNLLADFRKAEGDQISYGVQIKGNSSYGVLENNLVVCEYNTAGGVRVGLSLGGGGTGKQYARDYNNQVEHTDGIVRNNIVIYCSDVGLYLNKAQNTKVFNNTFYKTNGIDVRFPESSAELVNNLLTGQISDRDGGTSVRRNNLARRAHSGTFSFSNGFTDWFIDPAVGNFTLQNGNEIIDKGDLIDEVWEDFCGNPRDERPDIGAIEYGVLTPCMPFGKIP